MPPDDRRARLRATLRELRASAAVLPDLIGAFEARLAEQERDLDVALRDAEQAHHERDDALNLARQSERRTEAEQARRTAVHAADLAVAKRKTEEAAQAATALADEVEAAVGALIEAQRGFDSDVRRLTAELTAAQDDARRLRTERDRLAREVVSAQPTETAERASSASPEPAAARRKRLAEAALDAGPFATENATLARVAAEPDGAAPVPGLLRPTPPTLAVPPQGYGEGVIAEAFRSWCAAASPVVGKVEFFGGHLRQILPEASVAAVYRDANSQAQPVVFRASGGSSPVEYWLVLADGRHWLLPQPLGGAQFRELAPCFDGTAAPSTLAHVRPADVRAVGGQFELTRPGEVA